MTTSAADDDVYSSYRSSKLGDQQQHSHRHEISCDEVIRSCCWPTTNDLLYDAEYHVPQSSCQQQREQTISSSHQIYMKILLPIPTLSPHCLHACTDVQASARQDPMIHALSLNSPTQCSCCVHGLQSGCLLPTNHRCRSVCLPGPYSFSSFFRLTPPPPPPSLHPPLVVLPVPW